MIRVQGLLQGKENRKDWAGQTEGILPRISGVSGKWRKGGRIVEMQGNRTFLNKSSSKAWGGVEGGRISCINTLPSPSSAHKQALTNKQNQSSPSTQSSKLSAKAFKFLLFEDELLRTAILKHLSGRQLSRQERFKLRSNVHFSFLRQDSCRGGFDEEVAVIDIPEQERVEVSIEELVEGVRQVCLQLGVGAKGRDVLQSGLHRRMAQIVAGLLAKSDRPILHSEMDSSYVGKELLRKYLRRYVGEIEKMVQCLSQSNSKGRLMGFYEEIYNRYQSVPFSDSPDSSSPSTHTIEHPTDLPLHPPVSSLPRGKTNLNEQSFIKLRFYNNLRKQILTLSEDTEKIMQEESSKLGHS